MLFCDAAAALSFPSALALLSRCSFASASKQCGKCNTNAILAGSLFGDEFPITPDADSWMRKGLCAETSSVSHDDKDSLHAYRAAVMEFDRAKLPATIDVAEQVIHQCLRKLPIANSKEHRELSDVSRFPRECSSAFGGV
jgi:hypothetical protein